MNVEDYKKNYTNYIESKDKFNRIVKQEIEAFHQFMREIKDIYPFEMIAAKKSYLVYKFENSTNESISPFIYYCDDGYVRFAVFDKNVYQAYNREVHFESEIPFAIVPLENVMQKLSLSDLIGFVIKEMESYEMKKERTDEDTEDRKAFLSDLQEITGQPSPPTQPEAPIKETKPPTGINEKDKDVIARLKKIQQSREFFGDNFIQDKDLLGKPINN